MKFFASLCFFFLFKFVFTQSYSFTNYSIPQGLAQTQIKTIVEDEDGYLWLGTLGGLSRFNGSEFHNFSSEDGLLNNRITALYSNKNVLWIGHQGGLSLYKARKFTTWSFGNENQNIAASKIIYFENKLIIATNGNGLYVLDKNELKHIPLKTEDENRIRGLEVLNGHLYLATRAGLILSKDLKNFVKIEAPFDLNLTWVVKKDQAIYLSNTDGQIYQFVEAKKKFKLKLDIQQEVYLDNFIIDSKWNIWSACFRGLIYKNPQKNLQILDQNSGLSFNVLNVVYEDKNGTIWIGTDGKGLFRFGGTNFVHFNQNNGIQSNLITSSLETEKQHYFFGSYENGLIEYKNSVFKQYSFDKAMIWASTIDAYSNLWLGTDKGLFKVNEFNIDDRKTEKFSAENGSPGEKVTCFYKENNSKIYVGGSAGISLISNGKVKNITRKFNETLIGTIHNISRFQNKLLCAADGGLFEFENGTFRGLLLKKTACYSLKTDAEGNLWIGTETALYFYDGKILTRVNLADQPASNFINFINFQNNKMVVGTNNGLYLLSELQKHENATIRHYGIEDGLLDLETNINSSLFDSQGILWFGTASGLVQFDLSSFDINKTIAVNLNVLNMKLNFQNFDYKLYNSKLNAEGLPISLTLPYNKNNITLELDGIQLKNYPDLRYEYWLEGLDPTWVPAFRSPIITLSNLPSGNYTLHIRSKNKLGDFSKEFILKININPVYYKTWWFITSMILLGLALIFVYFRFRINSERAERYKESLEFKTKLLSLEQQSLNASMNRHFIFNSLNSIQYFINTQDKYSANKYLTNFAKLIRKNLDASTENNNQVTLQQEIERLELYLSLEAMRFKDRFDYTIETGDLDLEAIEVPAMLFQPFVENSIIHGILPNPDKKGLISIKLSQEKDKIIVSIEDNGIGIENSMSKKGLLSGDHRSQGMEITAKRISLLNKLSEENYELEGPFQLEDENRLINGTRVLIKIPLKNLVD